MNVNGANIIINDLNKDLNRTMSIKYRLLINYHIHLIESNI
jgi:hypothetical protein